MLICHMQCLGRAVSDDRRDLARAKALIISPKASRGDKPYSSSAHALVISQTTFHVRAKSCRHKQACQPGSKPRSMPSQQFVRQTNQLCVNANAENCVSRRAENVQEAQPVAGMVPDQCPDQSVSTCALLDWAGAQLVGRDCLRCTHCVVREAGMGRSFASATATRGSQPRIPSPSAYVSALYASAHSCVQQMNKCTCVGQDGYTFADCAFCSFVWLCWHSLDECV
jgi:hypothetical protein